VALQKNLAKETLVQVWKAGEQARPRPRSRPLCPGGVCGRVVAHSAPQQRERRMPDPALPACERLVRYRNDEGRWKSLR
jgi:hypothetical protein